MTLTNSYKRYSSLWSKDNINYMKIRNVPLSVPYYSVESYIPWRLLERDVTFCVEEVYLKWY